MKKFLALLLAFAMVFALCACGETAAPATETVEAAEETAVTAAEPAEEAAEEPATYTYYSYTSAIGTNWNPHTWENSGDSDIISYITTPFMSMSILDSEEQIYQWTYEAAESVTDVTADHQDLLTKYATDSDGTDTEGYVFEIVLRPEVKWQDGTPINADSYEYSLKALLDPEMLNYRANLYYSGESAFAGAKAYFYQGSVSYTDNYNIWYTMDDLTLGEDGQYLSPNGELMYIGIYTASEWCGGYSIGDYVDSYGEDYFDITNWETIVAMVDENGVIPLTDENLALFAPVTTGNEAWGETEEELPAYFVVAETFGESSWDDVGFIKTGDYSFLIVTEVYNDINVFYGMMTDNWLVYEPYYEGNKTVSEDGYVTTTYNSSFDTTMSFGPYMIESLQEDRQIVYVQNPNWWNYQQNEDGSLVSYTQYLVDGENVEQYKTTKIVIDVMDDNAAKLAFLKGELTDWSPSASELSTYSTSDQLYRSDETYTIGWFFDCDLDDLKEMDASKGNTNSVVLSSYNFRKAMSFALDRATYVTATAGYKPVFYTMNSQYYYDVYNDPTSQYRATDEAKGAIVKLYGVEYGEGQIYATLDEAYESITGYNVTLANELFTEACKELVEAGLYTEGEEIVINLAMAAGEISDDQNMQITLATQMLNAALEGSGFGTITLTPVGNLTNRYAAVPAGEYAIGLGGWGGAAFYPYRNFQVYMDTDQYDISEGGCWDPSTETLTLTVNGEEVTMTYQEWSGCMVGSGVYAQADDATKLQITADLEYNFLNKFYFIPIYHTTVCALLSYQCEYYTDEYNIMYGFGGLNLLQWNYNDAEWAEFVASQGGELNYE